MTEATAAKGEILAAISNGLVHLHHEYYGKGPTKAKTYAINDTIVCMLQGGFTTVERTLIDQGRADTVHDMRRNFQLVMEGQFRGVVEKETGRTVIAYMSTVHTNPDLAVELFVLERADPELVGQHEQELALDGAGGLADQ